MAQQLKYIACLRIMMSELATLGSNAISSSNQSSIVAGAGGFAGAVSAIAAGSNVPTGGSGVTSTGSIVLESGGQLRQELHLWLEKQVLALREMCGYRHRVAGEKPCKLFH